MTLTADWTCSIRGLTFGAGTVWQGLGGIGGLGIPAASSPLRIQGARDGTLAGLDRLGSRLITIPFTITGSSPTSTMHNYRTLATAWRRSTSGDVALDVRWPGAPASNSTMRFYGRPLGVTAPLTDLKAGVIVCQATFEATDPYPYGAAVTLTNQSGSFTVPFSDLGDVEADTYRATIVITGDGSGAPLLTNTTDNGRALSFTPTLALGDTYTVSLLDMSVLHGVVSAEADLAPNSGFRFWGGVDNALVLANAGHCDLTIEPAYHT